MFLEQSLKGNLIELRSLDSSLVLTNYVRWMNTPKVNKYLESRHVEYSEESIRDYICKCNKDESSLLLGIYISEVGKHIGNIKLGNINKHHSRGYIGLLIGEESYWGKGIATESIILITQYALKQLKLRMILAGFYSNNVASIRAFNKAGFDKIAFIPEYWISDNKCVDHIVMRYMDIKS